MSPIDLLTSLFKRAPSGLQFTLAVNGLSPTTFAVIDFQYTSRYNDLFYLDVSASSANAELDPEAILDNVATLSIWQDGELIQTLSGMVSSFEEGDSGFRLTHYRLQITADLWRATLRHNSRIFQQKDIQTILSAILAENKVADYAFILRGEHPRREFCVQYQETDFEFFQRITAEEGIYYYFEQNNGQHRLILSDDAETLNSEKAVSIPYNVNKNAQLQEKCITTFNRSERVRPSQVSLKDYTFKKPNWAAQFESTAKDAENQRSGYEHYDFPGRFKDARGKQYSQYRLDSLRQDAHLGWGESNSAQLHPGTLFQLKNHSTESLNTFWQLTDIEYHGQQPQSSELEAGEKGTILTNRFYFIPRDQTWRAPQQTKPRVDGPQMAIVVGPPGEEIYTDKYGRIRLQFLWDREGEYNDHSSCWIRVTQPWAGKGWGMMAIPRIGHEVLVDFLEGDPDQPIVTGRTYHANMPLPAGFPKAKPQMDLMSQTHKGGGHNGIMMDDSTNGQRLNLHAQRDMNTIVLNNRSTKVEGNHSETVMGNQSIQVDKTRYKEVLADETTVVKQNAMVKVGEQYKLLVQGNVSIGSSEKDIKLITTGAQITLSHSGDIDIQGQAIQFNGETVHLNPLLKDKAEEGKTSEGGSTQGESSAVYSASGEASLISRQSSGVMDANAKLLTAQGMASFDANKGVAQAAGSAALMDLNMTHPNGNINSKVGYVAGSGEISSSSGIGVKGKVEAVAVSLEGKHSGDYGSIEGGMKVFSADAEGVGKVFTGEEGKYGFDAKVAAQASAIAGEAKGCIGSEESWVMVCGKIGGNAGPAFDAGGKFIVDTNEETLRAGGNLKVFGGIELEGKINWKKIKEIFE
ncbi:type VI secretion system tip protein VgrG [Aggregatibacter actinomycetemcomitans]|nr:type VI secretion system tip protein VgrG [Aggregatibacter actinomycetemcomitans]